MKRVLITVAALLLLALALPASAGRASGAVRCEVAEGDTLVVSGSGEVEQFAAPFTDREKAEESKIRKLVVKEGITRIADFSNLAWAPLEEIILPDSLVEIGEDAFDCRSLKRITFGDGLKKIGSSAFIDCVNLREIVLPDSVEEIGWGAFMGCIRLKRLVLPASLKNWGATMVEHCPALRTVVNRSRISCELPWYKKYVTWKVGGRKTRVIPPGATGRSVGKKIPIKWNLMGGRATEKLPRYHRFGTELKFKDCVKRDGYSFVGWTTAGCYGVKSSLKPGDKHNEIFACWFKFKVVSRKKGTATIYYDVTGARPGYVGVEIRYANNRRMRQYNSTFSIDLKGKVTIKNLEPGRVYYFRLGGDLDSETIDIWTGKKKVMICR